MKDRQETLFPEAAAAPEIRRGALLNGAYRWTLTRDWGEGARVCFIGLNPSTADHTVDDPTVRRWIHFARSWGFAGFTAVNLYPFRSPAPSVCERWSRWQDNGPDYHARDALIENLALVAEQAKRAALVVACWGAGTWDPQWVDRVIKAVQEGVAPWPSLWCFDTAKDGAPMHPMARGRCRIPDDAQPRPWRLHTSTPELLGA